MTKNILIISILLFILSSILFGRVPIDENKIRITSTFGEFRTDHFHNGVISAEAKWKYILWLTERLFIILT